MFSETYLPLRKGVALILISLAAARLEETSCIPSSSFFVVCKVCEQCSLPAFFATKRKMILRPTKACGSSAKWMCEISEVISLRSCCLAGLDESNYLELISNKSLPFQGLTTGKQQTWAPPTTSSWSRLVILSKH